MSKFRKVIDHPASGAAIAVPCAILTGIAIVLLGMVLSVGWAVGYVIQTIKRAWTSV